MRGSALAKTTPLELPWAVRQMSEPDLDAIARLFANVQREIAPEPFADSFETYIASELHREFRRLHEIYVGIDGPTFWVLEVDEQIVGTVGLLQASGRSIELRHLYVCPSTRRRGLGWSLLHEALNKARALGASEVWLSVPEIQVAAIEMFLAAGFRRAEVLVDDGPSALGVGSGIERIVCRRHL